MNARHSRTVRGAAAAAVATWLAAVSHTLGGGVSPAPALVLVVIALAAPITVALAGRRLGLIRLSLGVLVTQMLLHVAFAATAGLDPTAPSRHVHGGVLATNSSFAVLLPDAGMTTAHVIAALVTVAVLHRGERVLRAVAGGVRRLLRPAAVVLPAPPARRAVGATVFPLAVPAVRLLSSVASRRGPPLFVAAAS